MIMCSRCHKRVAVIFLRTIKDGKDTQEGFCVKCAKELGIKPIDDILAQTGMAVRALFCAPYVIGGERPSGVNLDFFRVRQPQRERIAVDAQLHGIAHGRELFHRHFCSGQHAHIQKMLPQRALASHGGDHRRLADA